MKFFCLSALACWILAGSGALAQTNAPSSLDTLQTLSLEDLAQLQVTSVSKSPQALSVAPAAVFVITQHDIQRSGAQTLPEVLRLAPNLIVAQSAAGEYDISARGFSGNDAFQNFPNKLLVLIDGRSVYTPLFSGVYWDMQHVPLATIDRIEVISGPGAALWGANAVNGVINVTTRDATETSGGHARIATGTEHTGATLRYGGKVNDVTAYRAYVDGLWQDDTQLVSGGSANDARRRLQAGFRFDIAPPGRDAFVVQGDIYDGRKDQAGVDQDIAGHNVLGRWRRTGYDGAELSLQGYYDYYERTREEQGVAHLEIETYDLQLQHRFALGDQHSIVWGGGARIEDYEIVGTDTLLFDPDRQQLNRANLFLQDTIRLGETLRVTLGVKAEDDPFEDVSWLPNVRASWTPARDLLIWGAVSQAIRSPTPFDRDVREVVGGTLFLRGDPQFRSENLTAYELGIRTQPTPASNVSISVFHNDYEDLRSIEITPTTLLPLVWGNGMAGDSTGVEVWADLDVTPWWRLGASYAYVDTNFAFKPGASGLGGLAQGASDPPHRATLSSSLSLGDDFVASGQLRYVDALTYSSVPSYIELNARLAWRVGENAELSVAGRNLLHEEHLERPAPASLTPREVFAQLRLAY